MAILTKMSLELYKREVENCLISLRVPKEHMSKLMKMYEQDIQTAYEQGWSPIEIALPMSMGL